MPGINFLQLREKTLTTAEKNKREEVAKAIKRENPDMDKSMKMAIATATAKRVAEDAVSDYMAKGGKVTTAPYKKPRKAEKTDYSSKHIGGKGEHKSGRAANTTSPKPVGEETEQIDELSKKTVASYVKKASSSSHPNSASNLASRAAFKLSSDKEDDGEKEDHKSFMRSKNIAKAVDRLTKEETEQIDELSKATVKSYADKKSYQVHSAPEYPFKKKPRTQAQAHNDFKGMVRAMKRLTDRSPTSNEEVEDHSDPLSEEEYDRIRDTYGRGAAKSMMNSRWNPQHPQFYGKKSSTSTSTSSSADKHYHKVPYAQKDDAKKEGMRWDSGAKKWYHSSASASSSSKFQKEEVEIMEGPMPASVIRQKTTLGNMSPTDLHGHFKEIASKRGKTVETSARETAWRHGYGHMSSHYWDKFKHLDTKSEEVVQVDEISKKKTQKYLNRAMDDFTHQDMGSRNANTAAERQQYAKKKVDRNIGISRAMLRLLRPKNEEAVQVDELKKSTLASYTNKVVDPVYGIPRSTSKLKQRLAGLQRAHQRAIGKKPTSEEVVSEGPYSSGQLKPTQDQLKQAQKIPSGGRTTVIRDKDEKGTYTQTMKDGKVVSKTYEEVELDELNQLTLQRYASKAKSVGMQGGSKAAKHLAGAKRAKEKLKYGEYSEEVHQVNELSTNLLAKYKTAAAASAKEADKSGKFDLGHKRFKGMLKATSKQFKNEAGKK